MDLGISCYQIGDGPLATALGAQWAHAFADVTEGIPNHTDLIADMVAHGCRPVIDLRTATVKLGEMIANERGPVYDPPEGNTSQYDAIYSRQVDEFEASIGETRQRCKAVIRWYADSIGEYLERHPQVKDVEVWGSAEVARFIHGNGELLDYSSILKAVYEVVKERHPEVRVWTGGFGCNCDCSMIERGLSVHCNTQFDVCNMHPFLQSTGFLDVDQESLARRLRHGRKILDDKCARQPFAASGVGVPTVAIGPPPAQYGRFWRVFSARAIDASSALEWWLMLLGVLRDADFEVACLLARDVSPPARFHHFSGLTNADGTYKPFTEDLINAARSA